MDKIILDLIYTILQQYQDFEKDYDDMKNISISRSEKCDIDSIKYKHIFSRQISFTSSIFHQKL